MGFTSPPKRYNRLLHSPISGQLFFKEQYGHKKIQIQVDSLWSLNNFQKLLGDISWLHPHLGITTGQLQPLFNTLKGDPDPTSPRQLSSSARQALQLVNKAIQQTQVFRIDPSMPIKLIICPTKPQPTGLLWQDQGPIEWLHLPSTGPKVLLPYYDLVGTLIHRSQKRLRQLLGNDPQAIIVPCTQKQQHWLFRYSDTWQLALAQFPANIDCHCPANKLLSSCYKPR